ncbi:ABC transporter ATP-binding protein uup [compost metagenome]
MKDFLFQPEQIRTPIKNLSGGERARLMLARMLARPSNLLILDEPTNDLDIETLDLLQEIVAGYNGTVILVSHDRDFLDRTVTSTIAPAAPDAPDGRWIEYAGGYTDMLAQRKGAQEERKKAEKAAEKPKAENAASSSDAPKAKGKLSYKQKFALENIPKEMEKAEAEIALREKKMADPNLFTKDPASFNKLAAEMEKLREKLTQMEEEWLELEMLREEIEG